MKFCETNVFSCLSVTLVAEIEITIDFLKKGPYPNIVFREISLIESLLPINAHLEVGERVADHLVLGGEGARPDGVEEGHPVKVGHRLHQLGHGHLGVPLARVVPGV